MGGAVVSIIVVVGALVGVAVILYQRLLQICPPSKVLIFSGRMRRRADGRTVGYRFIQGGSAVRVPYLERVDEVDLTNMPISLNVKGAYAKGGIPLNVQGVANVKVSSTEPMIDNALERFLSVPREAIMKVAQDTLEGNLRGVLATLTPEQVNDDKIRFQQSLLLEADHDLRRLGLELDTLTIQNVSDDVKYLDSIGRVQSAEMQRQARVAEAQAHALAVVRDASNQQMSSLAEIDAEIQIAGAKNERRIADAVTSKEAMKAEQRSEVQALVARAKADLLVQEARIEQTRRRLDADVIQPARARATELQAQAAAAAASIVEDGRATSEALLEITKTWKKAGHNARDIFLMQKLETLMRQVVGTIRAVKIDKYTVLPGGNGTNGNGGHIAAKAASTAAELRAALGIDIGDIVQRLADKGGPPPVPSRS
ncbi:MAG TPA: SPFH domain-containing protein [Myxococcota bacterium]|jgi:flotillin|nr:SPFH domain-containing protein [Myxococcota bacterium]